MLHYYISTEIINVECNNFTNAAKFVWQILQLSLYIDDIINL